MIPKGDRIIGCQDGSGMERQKKGTRKRKKEREGWETVVRGKGRRRRKEEKKPLPTFWNSKGLQDLASIN